MFGGLHPGPEGRDQRRDADAVFAGRGGQGTGIKLNLHRGARNGLCAFQWYDALIALNFGQQPLDQQHCPQLGTVSEEATNIARREQPGKQHAVENGSSHQNFLSICDSISASSLGWEKNGEWELSIVNFISGGKPLHISA